MRARNGAAIAGGACELAAGRGEGLARRARNSRRHGICAWPAAAGVPQHYSRAVVRACGSAAYWRDGVAVVTLSSGCAPPDTAAGRVGRYVGDVVSEISTLLIHEYRFVPLSAVRVNQQFVAPDILARSVTMSWATAMPYSHDVLEFVLGCLARSPT